MDENEKICEWLHRVPLCWGLVSDLNGAVFSLGTHEHVLEKRERLGKAFRAVVVEPDFFKEDALDLLVAMNARLKPDRMLFLDATDRFSGLLLCRNMSVRDIYVDRRWEGTTPGAVIVGAWKELYGPFGSEERMQK